MNLEKICLITLTVSDFLTASEELYGHLNLTWSGEMNETTTRGRHSGEKDRHHVFPEDL